MACTASARSASTPESPENDGEMTTAAMSTNGTATNMAAGRRFEYQWLKTATATYTKHYRQRLLWNKTGYGTYSTSSAKNPTKQQCRRHLSNIIGHSTHKSTTAVTPTQHHLQWPLLNINSHGYYTTQSSLLYNMIDRDMACGTYTPPPEQHHWPQHLQNNTKQQRPRHLHNIINHVTYMISLSAAFIWFVLPRLVYSYAKMVTAPMQYCWPWQLCSCSTTLAAAWTYKHCWQKHLHNYSRTSASKTAEGAATVAGDRVVSEGDGDNGETTSTSGVLVG